MGNNYKPMKMDILDIDEYIKKHRLIPVTSNLVLSNKDINPEGLFSTKIFGTFGSPERMTRFSYINLNTTIIHPVIYYVLTQLLGGKLVKILNKEINYKYNKETNTLEESNSNEDNNISGFKLLYKYWDIISDPKSGFIKDTGTKQRNENLEFLNKYRDKKNLVFIDKYLVLPAGLRDINTVAFEKSGIVSYDEINDIYLTILSKSNSIGSALDIISETDASNTLTFDIQQEVYKLYLHLLDKLSGKTGFLKAGGLVKKPIVYSSRGVIINPRYIKEKYNEDVTTNIKIGEVGVPVSMLLADVKPFVIHYLNRYIEDENNLFIGIRKFLKDNFDKEDKLSDREIINKFIDRCIKDTKFLQEIIDYVEVDNRKIPIYVMDFLKNEILIPILRNKYALCTRYPINNKLSNQILKPIPYTTDDVEVINMPIGKYELTKNPKMYGMGIRLNASSFEGFGADVDGDTISVVVFFSNDVNRKIEKEQLDFRRNCLNSAAEPTVAIGIENLFGLNILTREK